MKLKIKDLSPDEVKVKVKVLCQDCDMPNEKGMKCDYCQYEI